MLYIAVGKGRLIYRPGEYLGNHALFYTKLFSLRVWPFIKGVCSLDLSRGAAYRRTTILRIDNALKAVAHEPIGYKDR